MGLVCTEKENTHTLPITWILWVVFLQSGSFISVSSVLSLRVFVSLLAYIKSIRKENDLSIYVELSEIKGVFIVSVICYNQVLNACKI